MENRVVPSIYFCRVVPQIGTVPVHGNAAVMPRGANCVNRLHDTYTFAWFGSGLILPGA